ncbi:MAG: hypothetical protein AAGB29_05940 [Planctomycetota bacterium]
MTLRSALAAWLALSLTASAMALGSDHPDGDITPQPAWPEGMAEVVNAGDRVHGFWVNATDVFFFAGDTDRLNAFLAGFDAIETIDLTVTLHPGRLEARSPWDKDEPAKPADWRLVMESWGRPTPETVQALNGGDPAPWAMQLDVYLGGEIDLDRLVVPERMTVKSGGEIEAFIRQHQGRD